MKDNVLKQAIDEIYSLKNKVLYKKNICYWLNCYNMLKYYNESFLDEKKFHEYSEILYLLEIYYNSSLINSYISQETIKIESLTCKKNELIDFLIENEPLYNDHIKPVHYFTRKEFKIKGAFIIEKIGESSLNFPTSEHYETLEFYTKYSNLYESFFSQLYELNYNFYCEKLQDHEELTLKKLVSIARNNYLTIPDLIKN